MVISSSFLSMQKLFRKNIPNHAASERLAQTIARDHLSKQSNWTLFLDGGLGAGKTYLVTKILKELGLNESVSSPTYTIVEEYQWNNQRVAHFDFYRLESSEEFFTRGFADIATDTTVNKCVEWGDRIGRENCQGFSGTHFVLKINFGVGVGMRTVELLQTIDHA